ncbi:MAG: DUF2283 domain-containing protein [Persephonella sp.]|nr:DUF2283 domain-containing protein [Persephonella sp.]
MKIIYDKEAEALYIRLTDKEIEYTEELTPNIIVDYSKDGKPVGIEVLNIKRELSPSSIKELTSIIP